jgi:aspartyl aminopeptidase
MKTKISKISKYKEVFIETHTKRLCVAIMKQYEKKGYKTLGDIQKDEYIDRKGGYVYFLFMNKTTGGYVGDNPVDVMPKREI